MKLCRKCDTMKAMEEFHRSTRNKNGRASTCKVCQSVVDRARAPRTGYNQEWRRANRELHARLTRQWREANKERQVASMAAWRAANAEKVRADWRAWAAANPELLRKGWSRKRARRRKAFVEDVDGLVLLEMDDGVCGLCGRDVDPLDFHVDHVVPLSRGGEHSYANTQIAHPFCNLSKHAALPWEESYAR